MGNSTAARKSGPGVPGRPAVTPSASQQVRMKALEFAFRHNISSPSALNAEEQVKTAEVYERYIAG